MGVFDHVTIRASEPAASERFYDTVLAAIGIRPAHRNELGTEYELDFCIGVPDDEQPVTRGLHIAWHVPSEEAVQAFWQAGVDAGYRSDGEPGPRPQYGDDYYGGFLLDPDGNSAEAVHIAGSGNVQTAGRAAKLGVTIAGSGDLDADELETDNANVSIAGSGDARLTAHKDLSVSIVGSGDVTYRGNAQLRSRVTGSGSVTHR